MQTLTILGSTLESPVDICLAGSPTPAIQPLRNQGLSSSLGPSPRVFFSREGGGRGGWAGVRHALVPARFHSVCITASSESLRDASRMPPRRPKPLQDASQGTPRPLKLHHPCSQINIIHANLLSPPLFNSSFIPLHAF